MLGHLGQMCLTFGQVAELLASGDCSVVPQWNKQELLRDALGRDLTALPPAPSAATTSLSLGPTLKQVEGFGPPPQSPGVVVLCSPPLSDEHTQAKNWGAEAGTLAAGC